MKLQGQTSFFLRPRDFSIEGFKLLFLGFFFANFPDEVVSWVNFPFPFTKEKEARFLLEVLLDPIAESESGELWYSVKRSSWELWERVCSVESEESSWITKGLLEGLVLRDFCLSLLEDFGTIGVEKREKLTERKRRWAVFKERKKELREKQYGWKGYGKGRWKG